MIIQFCFKLHNRYAKISGYEELCNQLDYNITSGYGINYNSKSLYGANYVVNKYIVPDDTADSFDE